MDSEHYQSLIDWAFQSLQHAKLAVTEDRPILMDYWMASGPDASKPFIGVHAG
jgi:hypothetical protein